MERPTMPKFTIDKPFLLPVGPEGGEDEIEVMVRIHFTGTPAQPAVMRESHGLMVCPACDAEVEVERIEIREDGPCAHATQPEFWRTPDYHDQPIVGVVTIWADSDDGYAEMVAAMANEIEREGGSDEAARDEDTVFEPYPGAFDALLGRDTP